MSDDRVEGDSFISMPHRGKKGRQIILSDKCNQNNLWSYLKKFPEDQGFTFCVNYFLPSL